MYDINLVMPHASLGKDDYMIPLGISYLTSVLKEHGFKVKTQDLSFQKTDWNTKVLGVSFNTFSFGEARKLVEEAKKRGVTTIAGGPHTKMDAPSCLDIGFDYVFLGEGEITLPKILPKLGEMKSKTIVGETPDLDELPMPDFSWITDECEYISGVPINTSRGCPYQCSFCSHVHGSKWRCMSPEKMLETYVYLLGFNKSIYMNDDTFSISVKRLEKFRDLLKEEGVCRQRLLLHGGLRVDHINERLMKVLMEMGLTNMGIGIEHTDNNVLKLCKKGITIEDTERAIKTVEKFGFAKAHNTAFYLIIGLPGSTFEKDMEARMWANKYPAVQSWCIATPFPSSDLFKWVGENANWLVDHKNYENYAGMYSRGVVMFDTEDYPVKQRKRAWGIVKSRNEARNLDLLGLNK